MPRTGSNQIISTRRDQLAAASQRLAASLSRICDKNAAPEPNAKPIVSIIILALNQLDDTRKCLDSIQQCTQVPHELILVDNGSTDGIPAFFENWRQNHPNCTVIRNHGNKGFAAGNNQGLSLARGRYVLLLNNDTVVTDGWLEGMLAHFERDPLLGILGPMSNYVVGPQLVPSPGYKTLEEMPGFAENWRKDHVGQSLETRRVIGFCLMASRPVIDAIGGLDPVFGSGNFEDDDFCLRAHFAGFGIRIAQDVFIHHTGSRTFKGARVDYNAAIARNLELFKQKWQVRCNAGHNSYEIPSTLPAGVVLKVDLPKLDGSHKRLADARCWTEQSTDCESVSAPGVASTKCEVPRCALLGKLELPRELLAARRLEEAWNSGLSSIAVRPFHPEAYLLLAEIAHAACDYGSARLLAQHARELAPEWKPARRFVNKCPKGGKRPAWLTMPELSRRQDRLSVCLIAKNEEKFLSQCLASVKALAHQIIVVDTGSTDRTAAIAQQHGAEVYQFTWCDDFSAARNAALEHATGDWVLVLDADEELSPDGQQKLPGHLEDGSVMAWRLPIHDGGKEDAGRTFVPRLFRNAPGLFFTGRIHEQIFGAVDRQRRQWGLDNRLGEALLIHHGYASEVIRDRNKMERNLRLLEIAIQEQPNDPNLVMNLGLEYARAGRETEALAQYRRAFRLVAALPVISVPPELREALLAQYSTRLTKAQLHDETVQVLTSSTAVAGNGLSASLHLPLALAYFELGKFRESAAEMRHCLAKRDHQGVSFINKDIHSALPYHCLALCHERLGDCTAAEAAFRKGLNEPVKVDRLRIDYAKFLEKQNRPVEALECLHQVIQIDAKNRLAWQLGSGIALSKPDFLEFASDWTGEAIKNVPGDPVLLSFRAEALLLLGQTEGAKTVFLQLWEGDRPPKALAGLLICEIFSGSVAHQARNSAEAAAGTGAFLEWYRKFISFGLASHVSALNENIHLLVEALPEAARIIRSALSEAAEAEPDIMQVRTGQTKVQPLKQTAVYADNGG